MKQRRRYKNDLEVRMQRKPKLLVHPIAETKGSFENYLNPNAAYFGANNIPWCLSPRCIFFGFGCITVFFETVSILSQSVHLISSLYVSPDLSPSIRGGFFFVSRRFASRIHEISDLKIISSRAQSSGRIHEVER